MAKGIQPCSNDDCRYPTRPTSWPAAENPGTKQRRKGGLCDVCFEVEHPRPRKNAVDAGPPRPETVSGLQSFMAARREREAAAARRQYPHLYRKDTA